MNKLLQLLLAFFLAITFSYAQGPLNALQLDGNYGYVLSSNSNRGITTQVTLQAWIKTTATKYQWVAGKYDRYGAQRGYHLIIKDGKAAMAGRDNSGIYRNSGYSNVDVNDGSWHHLTGVCDGSTWSIYVDGILQNSLTTFYPFPDLTNDAPFAIGKYFLVDDEYFVGQIDEVRLWKRALTQDEIRQHLTSKVESSVKDLVGYYNFDDSRSSIVYDKSKQQQHGTLQNISSGFAIVPSGAPIGDISVYRYPAKWDQSLELLDRDINFSVTRVSPDIRGFHLYKVFSAPASTSGIENHQEVKEYYGVFKVGPASAKYKVYYKKPIDDCSSKLYSRQNNADNTWEQVADTVGAKIMYYTTAKNYGEYAATSNSSTETISEQPVELNACADERVTLDATTKNATAYTWANGQTTPTLTVSVAGTYTATIIVNNCPLVRKFTVIRGECLIEPEIIIPNIITPNGDGKNDSFVVLGIEDNTLALKIFNRWGKSMYQTDRYDNNWPADGLPDGVYYYQLTNPRTKKMYKGWFEVIR